MPALTCAFERIARFSVWVSGFALLALALLVTVDVVSRKWFGATLAGSDEISGYVLACVTSWGYSFCLLRRSHIRIDVVYNRVPLRLRCLLDLVGLSALLLFMAFLTHRAAGVLVKTLESGAVSNTPLLTPLWIPQSLWLGGLVFFTATLIFVTVRTVLLLFRHDLPAVQALAGIPTISEEIAAEVGLDTVPRDGGERNPSCRR